MDSPEGSLKAHAVNIRHAFKHYGSKKKPNTVLDDLDMTVNIGTIYGLLGASGCGKTTLLSCIVGRKTLDSGQVWVLGGKPGTKTSGVPGKRVGYMPQDIALFGEFTIKETMMYFGWIFGMKSSQISARLDLLLNFLELPTKNRMVKNLSGGQKRRVSFAVALIHDPELLILDEPTVGVDPLLRQSIWSHLVQITKDGNKTVIITTHYIEEARQASTIGLMRNGKLLAEESPQALLTMYRCQTLEEVFLLLSRQQANSGKTQADMNNNTTSVAPNRGKKGTGSTPEKSGTNSHIDMGRESTRRKLSEAVRTCLYCSGTSASTGKIKALLQKNFLRMWRNVGVMLFIFALPAMQIILFCLAIGRDPKGLKIAIVNQEQDYINMSYQQCEITGGCSLSNLSCQYLYHLNNSTIEKVYYQDTDSAIEAVKEGEAWGVMFFTKNFTKALIARTTLGKDVDPGNLHHSEIHVWLDMSNQQIAIILQRDMQLAFQDFSQGILKSCKQNPGVARIPVIFQEPIYGSSTPSFTDFVAPGVILTVVFFLAVAQTSSALIVERMEGVLDRSWVAGVAPWEILLSHVLTQFMVMCVQTAIVLSFMILVFGVQCKGNVAFVIILTILQGLCGMCFGFVISAICELERNAIQLALGSFYPTLLLSGVIWPIEGMPIVLKFIATYLPLTLATESLRAVLSRGWNLIHKEVYSGFIATIVWIVLFLIISLIVLRFKKG